MRTFRALQPVVGCPSAAAAAAAAAAAPHRLLASRVRCLHASQQQRCFSRSPRRPQQWEWPEDHPNHPNNRDRKPSDRTGTGSSSSGSGGGGRDENRTYWYYYDSLAGSRGGKGRVRLDPYEELRRAKPLTTTSRIGRVARAPSSKAIAVLAVAGAFAFYFANMQTVPVSGRRRFNCFSQESVEKVADEQVKRIIYDVERQGGRFLGDWDWRVQMVKRVMKRLIPVSGMEDANWEIRVIDDPGTANAFVLPGGKVFVHSGLLPIARNEDGLAAVLGHEIAHNLAEHVAERMSGQIGTNILLGSVILLTGGFALIGGYWLGNSILDLLFGRPMGRRQETEADYIGLMMMSEACYDPRQALAFWKRMERQQQLEPPEWLSTHPSNHNRIQKISEWMPQALEKMEKSDCQGTSAFADLFKRALERGVIIQ
ncbi:peptidase family M48-domain-containing protein [Microdochium trichocladiopsis]|uniref:Peptidase family M48-domain-containing protein n=1 Tax=Microdochium trichocladiopsis TaxID=1682393 RepID=A0A9P8Y2U1_9PEZI|nr:peptidase family M48-domain-containing protein [Microdochium trichocladiopsis]KAH7026138.1 peptidase family M48-domain-containing protein [Microdochium trichocladiopsis]